MNDLTGREQFTRNAIVSWGMQIFIIAAGFIVPRQISDSLGPELLGVWDLGWATVRYLSLTSMGIGAALSRYVALYKSQGDDLALSKATTVVVFWQVIIALVVVLASVAIAFAMIYWVEFSTQNEQTEAWWVFFLLGGSLAIKMLAAPAGGIISGCHRWDIQHSINAIQDFGLALVMVAILILGGGLIYLAIAVVCAAVIAAIIRTSFAAKLCPTIQIHRRHWDVKVAKEMLRFGGKSVIANAPQVLVFQVVAVLLAGYAGPAVLAVFNRSAALIRILEQLVRKIATMFMPMTSGMLGLNKIDEAEELLINAGRYSMAIVLPLALALAIYGDILLKLWMGEGYADSKVLVVLLIGSVIPIAQSGTISVMAGMNAHGKFSITSLAITAGALMVLIPTISYFGWSEISAAMAVGISWTLGRGIAIPIYLTRYFSISLYNYFTKAIFAPLIFNTPLALLLLLGKLSFSNENWLLMLTYWLCALIVTAAIYWRWLISETMRAMISTKFTQ